MTYESSDPTSEAVIARQRQQIKEFVSKYILADALPIDDPNSFFQLDPPLLEPDDESHELLMRAKGDRGHYAILYAMDHARARLEEAQLGNNAAAVEHARSELREVEYLELAYTDPTNHPFLSPDEMDPFHEGRPLSDERDHLDYKDLTGASTDPPF